MIARTSFQLLLLANLLLAALWLSPRLGFDVLGTAGHEPERLQTQLHPEQVRLLGDAVAPPPAASNVGPTAPVAGVAPVSAVGGDAAAAAPLCMQLSGLSSEQVGAVNAAVRAAGEALTLREEALASNSYWINIPPQGGKAGAEKRVAELRQLGLNELFVVRDAGADQYAISLGLYRNEAAANRFFESVQKLGVKGVRVTVRENASSRIRLNGPAELVNRVTHDLADTLKGVEQAACPPA